jgi:iron complex transport system substrate-binding protein
MRKFEEQSLMRRFKIHHALLLTTALSLFLLLAPANTKAQDGGTTFPIIITDATGTEVTIESIDAIASGSGDVTEIIAALGFEDKLVGIDISSTYPADLLDRIPEIGFARRLAVEPIAAVNPSVFFCTQTCSPASVFDQLRELGIPVVIVPDNPESGINIPLEKITMTAAALGVPEKGEELRAQVALELDWVETAVANVQETPTMMFIYLRGRNLQLVSGTETPGYDLINAVGGLDVGAEAGVVGYQALSAEVMLNAYPEYIVMFQGSVDSAGGLDQVKELPGVGETPAAQNDDILVFDDQYILGMSTRTGQAALELASQVHPTMTWEYAISYPYSYIDATGTEISVETAGPLYATDEVLLETVQKLGFHAELVDAPVEGSLIIASQSTDWVSLRDAGYTVIMINDAAEIIEIAAALNVPGRGEALIARKAQAAN